MSNTLETLTDYEISGLSDHYCLADGHAYQDLHPSFHKIVQSLPQIWHESAERSIPEAERLFNRTYASFINSPILEKFENNFKICPTASNSIDLVGAVLHHLKYTTVMIEPAFDNLALLLRRRGVNLHSVQDSALFAAAEADAIDEMLPELKRYHALVLVNPNNPTGLVLSEQAFRNIVQFCKNHRIMMVIDNCFRVYRRNMYSDYAILLESGVSFVGFEDTGKVWPTQDLKASLMYFSDDLKAIFSEIYNEVYLCVSNLTLGILSAFFNETAKVGIKSTIWDVVDARRLMLRKAIDNSVLSVTDVSMNSLLPVEWLSCAETGKNDFAICQSLKELNLAVLPGRQFYWNSSHKVMNQQNVRISFMKREARYKTGLSILQGFCKDVETDLAQFNINKYSIAV